MTTARYSYVKSRTQRILRELNHMADDLDVLLKRMQSPLTETWRGKINPDVASENKMYVLRGRIKDAIVHLRTGVENDY